MKLFLQKFLLLPSLLLTNIIFLVSSYSILETTNQTKYSVKHEEPKINSDTHSQKNINIKNINTYYPKSKIENSYISRDIGLLVEIHNYNLTHKNYISSL